MYIENKMKEINDFVNAIKSYDGEITDELFQKLELLENYIGNNPTLIKYNSIALYNAGYIDESIQYLTEQLKKFNQSYELHSIMFELVRYTTEYENAIYSLAHMYKLSSSESIKKEVMHNMENCLMELNHDKTKVKKYIEMFKRLSTCTDYRYYPFDENWNSIIRKDVFKERDVNSSYIVNMYKTKHKNNIDDVTDSFDYLYEMIKGRFVDKNESHLEVKEGDIIAISSALVEPTNTNLEISNLTDKVINYNLKPNVIKYFKIKRNSKLSIYADNNIFISHFKKQIIKKKPKLVLQIFIDGLSYGFLEDNRLEELMPNVYNFFKKGYINNNCHANGEWTLPSVMSMSTGKYTTNHYVYDTNEPHRGEVNNKFITEYFEEAGYMTGRICPNWRCTPTYGYFKSTNRSVYSPMVERMFGSEVVMETIEHLETFKDFHNYVWMTIEDLHSIADGVAMGPLQDINIQNYENDDTTNDSEISVFRSYNARKIEEYKSAIKRVDLYLGMIFDYIMKNYEEDEYIITLNSDHGQKFIEESDYMFTRKRTNVPFMMRGKNVINKISDQLMSNVDVMPTLLKLCDIECNDSIDGSLLADFGGEERNYTITESIFPGQTYKLAINDYDHLYQFETKENTRRDGLIPISEYNVKLINLKTQEDESNRFPDKVQKYNEIAFEHIKEWIAFED